MVDKKIIEEAIYKMDTAELVQTHNNYCYQYKDMDAFVYPMSEIDDVLSKKTPTEILKMTNKDFNINDSYFYFDRCGDISSFDESEEALDVNIFPSDIANLVINDEDDLDSETLQELLLDE